MKKKTPAPRSAEPVARIVVEPRAFVVVGEDGVPQMLALQRGKTAVLRKGVQILAPASSAGSANALPSAATPQLSTGDKK